MAINTEHFNNLSKGHSTNSTTGANTEEILVLVLCIALQAKQLPLKWEYGKECVIDAT